MYEVVSRIIRAIILIQFLPDKAAMNLKKDMINERQMREIEFPCCPHAGNL